jgi:hypothetical protein
VRSLEHLEALKTTRRTVRYTLGWKITEDDEKAIARLPETAWETSLHQDGSLQEGYFVAELTGLNTRAGWPEGMRLIARRVRPTRRHLKKLTRFETKTGWLYCTTANNIRHMWSIAGSRHCPHVHRIDRAPAPVQVAAPAQLVQDQTVELGPYSGLRPLGEPTVGCRSTSRTTSATSVT